MIFKLTYVDAFTNDYNGNYNYTDILREGINYVEDFAFKRAIAHADIKSTVYAKSMADKISKRTDNYFEKYVEEFSKKYNSVFAQNTKDAYKHSYIQGLNRKFPRFQDCNIFTKKQVDGLKSVSSTLVPPTFENNHFDNNIYVIFNLERNFTVSDFTTSYNEMKENIVSEIDKIHCSLNDKRILKYNKLAISILEFIKKEELTDSDIVKKRTMKEKIGSKFRNFFG